MNLSAGSQQLRQIVNAALQGRNRSFQNESEQQKRVEESCQLKSPPAQIATQPETEETRHQHEVLEVSENSDLR